MLSALGAAYPRALEAATTPTRPGHARLDLGALALSALRAAGVARAGRLEGACTICDPRFESFRREGDAAGRMLHWVRTRG